MDIEKVDQWIFIARDIAIVSIGSFMLIYETVYARTPDYLLVGAGLALLGVPPALRLDQYRRYEIRKQNGCKIQKNDESIIEIE